MAAHRVITSQSDPIRVDFIADPKFPTLNLKLGMSIAPGRVEPFTHRSGYELARDLDVDLQVLQERNGLQVLVTLNQATELEKELGVPLFLQKVKAALPDSIHFPIPDMNVPTTSLTDFDALITEIIQHAGSGKVVIVHCREGKGRTGLVVACCLVKYGETPTRAIEIVRKTRKGTVQTFNQEKYVAVYQNYLKKNDKFLTCK